MAKKKKGGRRAALKGFAKGKFQSPVHSNGFKQDVLINMHGGDKGITADTVHLAAVAADAAGKSYFKYQGTTYKVESTPRGPGATTDDRAGNVK